MFYPTQLGSTDLNDYKDSKAYSYYKSGWFQPLYFHKLSGIKYCILKKEKCRPSQIISQINHKLRNYYGKIWINQILSLYKYDWNHFAAVMYRIETADRNGLTNPSCTNTTNQWLPNFKDTELIKVKDMNFGCEDFYQ